MKKRKNIWVLKGNERHCVPSLAPHLAFRVTDENKMDPALMRAEDVTTCVWVGYGIGKGVTNPKSNTSVFGAPEKMKHGLHADLVAGFPNVDPYPLCYEHNHRRGFGNFVRWVYFAPPHGGPGILGVDWSIAVRGTAGVADTVARVHDVVQTLARHGLTRDTRVVLLNPRMCEEPEITRLRHELELITIRDWVEKGEKMFAPNSDICSRCGLKTLEKKESFCRKCGAKPALVWERR